MKNIIFIAPPAAGKGTQSKLISEYYNIPHISLGDILREFRDPNTEEGKVIIKCQDERSLVPLDIILRVIKKRISESDCKDGYILDGFPRSIDQAIEYDKMLEELNSDIDLVVFMDIDKDLALKRTLSRIVCPNCKTSYNLLVKDLAPKKDGICNKCGNVLETRTDDNEQTFIKGFNTYIEKTLPLIEYYDKKGKLKKLEIKEEDSAEEIFEKIKNFIQPQGE